VFDLWSSTSLNKTAFDHAAALQDYNTKDCSLKNSCLVANDEPESWVHLPCFQIHNSQTFLLPKSNDQQQNTSYRITKPQTSALYHVPVDLTESSTSTRAMSQPPMTGRKLTPNFDSTQPAKPMHMRLCRPSASRRYQLNTTSSESDDLTIYGVGFVLASGTVRADTTEPRTNDTVSLKVVRRMTTARFRSVSCLPRFSGLRHGRKGFAEYLQHEVLRGLLGDLPVSSSDD
jgi:hypothetical protein